MKNSLFGILLIDAVVLLFTPLMMILSYSLPGGNLRVILHRIGEFAAPLMFTAFLPMVVANVLYFSKAPVKSGVVFGVFFGLLTLMTVAGLVNGARIHTKTVKITIEGAPSMRFALMSDLHLGAFTPKNMTQKIADAVLKEDPDFVILAGDIFDDDFESLGCKEEALKGLLALTDMVPVYSVEGNHDLLSPSAEKDSYIDSCGIRVLRDAAVQIDGYTFVFRRDIRNAEREELAEILSGIADTENASADAGSKTTESNLPLIVVDHNPSTIEETWEQGANLVLSGHTHGGQTFPGNLLFRLWPKYKTYGYYHEGNHYAIVTSGIGTYGCPVRLGVNNEIVLVEINTPE